MSSPVYGRAVLSSLQGGQLQDEELSRQSWAWIQEGARDQPLVKRMEGGISHGESKKLGLPGNEQPRCQEAKKK